MITHVWFTFVLKSGLGFRPPARWMPRSWLVLITASESRASKLSLPHHPFELYTPGGSALRLLFGLVVRIDV